MVTSAYLASSWCTGEIGAAHAQGSRLLPLRAEPDVVHPLLASTQYTDYTVDPAKARAALLEALRPTDAPKDPRRWMTTKPGVALTVTAVGVLVIILPALTLASLSL